MGQLMLKNSRREDGVEVASTGVRSAYDSWMEELCGISVRKGRWGHLPFLVTVHWRWWHILQVEIFVGSLGED
jgi:hypothetical protein